MFLRVNYMKTMPAKQVQERFGVFLDTVLREPVKITRNGRPVGVAVPADAYEEYEKYLEEKDNGKKHA